MVLTALLDFWLRSSIAPYPWMRVALASLAALCLNTVSSLHAQVPADSSPKPPSPPSFEEKLREVRFDLHVGPDGFSGRAAPLLEQAIAEARYVLVGEDHLSCEIPRFASAVCDLMAKGQEGLRALAMESGPQAAEFVGASLGQPDRLERMAALQRQFPDSMAFLNVAEENDLVAHAAQVSHNPGFQLWGLDQEFVGSAGWLLEQILATHPGPAASATLGRLQDAEKQAATQAQESGSPGKLWMFTADDRELSEVQAFLQREGNASANALCAELVASREIYLKNAQGSYADSNAQRARLMKAHLRQHLEGGGGATAVGHPPQGKVLLKFGEWHLYKGFNPLHQRDLGNWVAEWVEGRGESSLHLCVLGAKGTRLLYGGYDRAPKTEPFVMDEDKDYRWLKPAVDNQVPDPDAWTVYDLRRLRHHDLGTMDPSMVRLIDGYDLLVIVPELTPATLVR